MDRRKVLLIVAALVAALGAALVFVYAQGAEERASAQYDTVDVLVATQEISAGESANDAYKAGKIAVKSIPQTYVLTGATSDGGAFRDAFALTTMYPGEQLVPEKFGAATDVQAAVTLPVPDGLAATTVTFSDTGRLAGFVRPGDRVGIFITGTFPPSEEQTTRLLLPDVLVLATGSTTAITQPNPDGTTTDTGISQTLFTLAGTQDEIEKIQLATKVGELNLTLASETTKLKPGDGVNVGDLFD